MVELAKESTTMRIILDPMFVYFDMGQHWVGRHGLAMMVLSDMSYYMEYPGLIVDDGWDAANAPLVPGVVGLDVLALTGLE
ncbi:hypothetical protein ACET3Z_004953 [Daucus carota]